MASEMMDLFGRTEASETGAGSVKLDVVRMEYVGAESLSWEELFAGFDGLKDDETEEAPNILKVSSEILCAIVAEHGETPSYVRKLSLDSYFSEEVTGKYAIKVIQTAWRTSRDSFQVSTRNNELRYNAGATFEVDRLVKELPETLEPRKSRDWLIVNLDIAREFFGVDFRSTLWDRMRGR